MVQPQKYSGIFSRMHFVTFAFSFIISSVECRDFEIILQMNRFDVTCKRSIDIIIVIKPCWFDSQPEGLGVAFFATGPGLGLIMYILTTLEFPTHNFEFHLLTTNVNAKYYY